MVSWVLPSHSLPLCITPIQHSVPWVITVRCLYHRFLHYSPLIVKLRLLLPLKSQSAITKSLFSSFFTNTLSVFSRECSSFLGISLCRSSWFCSLEDRFCPRLTSSPTLPHIRMETGGHYVPGCERFFPFLPPYYPISEDPSFFQLRDGFGDGDLVWL